MFTQKREGTKHFGLWPLSDAANALFRHHRMARRDPGPSSHHHWQCLTFVTTHLPKGSAPAFNSWVGLAILSACTRSWRLETHPSGRMVRRSVDGHSGAATLETGP